MKTHETFRMVLLAGSSSPHVIEEWRELTDALQAEPHLSLIPVASTDELDPERHQSDVVVVLGGDGSILRACRKLGAAQLPMIGVNLGRLGFLADLSPSRFRKQLPTLRNRKFTTVEHLMFECEIRRADGTVEQHFGLNEVAVSSAGSLTMLDVNLEIDNEHVTTFSGDGVIVSTPVGSTAHSLSAGGPILRQNLQAFVITPICPHALTNRPIVDSADRVYRLSVVEPPPGVMMIIDGQIKRPVLAGDTIDIRKAPMTFKLIRLPGHSYYNTLHRKLGWGGQLRYRK